MENSPKLDGKVYIIHVKESVINDFNVNDLIYGNAYDVSAGLFFTALELFVRKTTIKCFLS